MYKPSSFQILNWQYHTHYVWRFNLLSLKNNQWGDIESTLILKFNFGLFLYKFPHKIKQGEIHQKLIRHCCLFHLTEYVWMKTCYLNFLCLNMFIGYWKVLGSTKKPLKKREKSAACLFSQFGKLVRLRTFQDFFIVIDRLTWKWWWCKNKYEYNNVCILWCI